MSRWPSRLVQSIPFRVVLFYVVVGGAAMLFGPALVERVPDLAPPNVIAGPAAGTEQVGAFSEAPPPVIGRPALAVGTAAGAAFLLGLPVAWVYMLTREKKGYRQTVVHTLVLLPMVVAGMSVLIKGSLSLAFGIAGIAAAVRFRNTLDDAKDAVYLLLSLAIGLGTAADMGIAFSLSAVFNLAALVIFYTDFGRTPPALEGERAQRQLERAIAIANRTSEFVARVDDAVLRELAPPQLDALAQRLRRRREEVSDQLPDNPELKYDARLRIVTTDADALRTLVEPVLETRVKRWRADPAGAAHDTVDEDEGAERNGFAVVAYDVRWRKGSPPEAVLAAVREQGAPFVIRAEVI
jgi:hypothetical protein